MIGLKKTHSHVLILVLTTFLTNCGSRELDVPSEEAFPSTFVAIRDRILKPRCENCHAKLLSHTALLGDLVVPGKPEESELYSEVKSGGMPLYSEKLGEPELLAIRTWILNGAKND